MYEDEPYSLEQYQKKISGKMHVIYLALSGGELIGDSVSFEKDGCLYIWALGVAKECRKKGIGAKLLEENEKFARKKGFRCVIVKVYNVSPEMQKLLIKRGYFITGVESSDKHQKYNAVHFALTLLVK